MALTINSNVQTNRYSIGPKTGVIATITFDSSYVTGGESLTPTQLGLFSVEACIPVQLTSPIYNYKYDTSASKLLVYGNSTSGESAVFAGNLLAGHTHNVTAIQAEPVVVAANTGTLANLPAAVTNIYVTAGGATGAFVVINSPNVPAAGEVAVDTATGAIAFNAADAVTAASVCYLPRATNSVSGGTPSGSVALSGGGSFGEVPNGTNLSALTVQLLFIGTGS